MTPSIVNRFIATFLASVLWCTTGCAKSDDQTTDSYSVAPSQADSTSKQNHQSFKAYIAEFSALVRDGNWEGLADITDFPLIIRGELDDEGSIEVDQKRFVHLIGKFFQEEVYLTINDELVAFTYRALMSKPHDKPEIDGDMAELHGFHFVRKDRRWKLKQITTYVHIVEKFAQGGKE